MAGWPVASLVDAARAAARRSHEDGFLRNFRRFYAAALTRNVPPFQFAQYSRFLSDWDGDLADYLMPIDVRGLQRRDAECGAAAADVQDKARFEQICRQHGLPCVPTLAVFDHGRSTREDSLKAWRSPIFVKALTGNKGAGAELWRPAPDGFQSSGGKSLSACELISLLRPQNCIVQPLLEDCPALQDLGTVALSSLRLVTARGTSTPPVVIAASISLALEPGSLTGHSGAQCGIDVENGTITAVLGVEEETADRLTGFALPQWNECVELVCKAHDEAFPNFTTLGWDVALTADGPLLLETNVGWGMAAHQKLTGPLGKTPLSEVIDELLAPGGAGRCPGDRQRPPAPRSPSPASRAVQDP